jgi:hypothetical protein
MHGKVPEKCNTTIANGCGDFTFETAATQVKIFGLTPYLIYLSAE